MSRKNGQADKLHPTSGKEMRARHRVTLPLPYSGDVVTVRAIGPDAILRLGRLPDALTPVIAELMEGKEDQLKAVLKPQTLEDAQRQLELIDVVCRCAMVEPRIVDDPQKDDEIGIDDLDWRDKQFLLSVLMASTSDLERFRDQQKRDVESVLTEPDNVPEAERNTEPEPVGD